MNVLFDFPILDTKKSTFDFYEQNFSLLLKSVILILFLFLFLTPYDLSMIQKNPKFLPLLHWKRFSISGTSWPWGHLGPCHQLPANDNTEIEWRPKVNKKKGTLLQDRKFTTQQLSNFQYLQLTIFATFSFCNLRFCQLFNLQFWQFCNLQWLFTICNFGNFSNFQI